MSDFGSPRDPVELARIRAEEAWYVEMDHTIRDRTTLIELDHAAEYLEFHGSRYVIEAGRSLVIPNEWEDGENVEYLEFPNVVVEGVFITYGLVSVGQLINSPNNVRALCLAMKSAILLPYFARVEECAILYIPILGVNSIERAA